MPTSTRAYDTSESGRQASATTSTTDVRRADRPPPPPSLLGRARTFGRRYLRNRVGLLGLVLVVIVVIVALFADVITPHAPLKSAAAPLLAPSRAHPMGTDDLGRDVLTAVVHGARTSLLVGVAVAGIAAFVGTVVGMVSGYFLGLVDDTLMRTTEFFQVMPRFFLAVIVVAFFGPGLTNVILVLGITSWTMIARIVRSEVLSLRERDFVVAAQAIGVRERTILRRHLFPNVLPALVTTVSLLAGHAILIEAGLSFLGLGDPNVVSWGYMLNNAQSFMRTAWWMALFPGLAITLSVLGINLTADALNDAWNPRL